MREGGIVERYDPSEMDSQQAAVEYFASQRPAGPVCATYGVTAAQYARLLRA